MNSCHHINLNSLISHKPTDINTSINSHHVKVPAYHLTKVAALCPMAGLGSTESASSFDQEFQFFQSWALPEADSGFSSTVLAVDELDYYPSLNKQQVQFIYDYYRQRVEGEEVRLPDLLNECDQYETRLPAFLESLSDNSGENSHIPIPPEATGSSQEPRSSSQIATGSSSQIATGSNSQIGTGSGQIPERSSPPPVVDSVSFESEISEVEGASGGDIVDGNFTKAAAKVASKISKSVKTSSKTPQSPSKPSSSSSSKTPSSSKASSSSSKTSSASSSKTTKSPRQNVFVPEVPNKSERFQIQNELIVLQKEHELLEVNRKCIGCKVRNREIAYLPCGHFLMCKVCAEPVFECQKCKKDILATAQTFLS